MERLRFIFWQNINSMHQSAFLKELAVKHDVTLVTMCRGTGRETMGWHEPDLRNVTLLHLAEIDWKSLIRKHAGRNAIHVFAGLHAFAPLHRAMLFAMRHSCRVGLYAEPLVMRGAAGLIKELRGRIDARRFADRLEFILCIGLECKQQYLDWGFPSKKLYDWAYVTENFESPQFDCLGAHPFRIIFPASCSKRKGADLLLEAVTTLASGIHFELVCHSLPPGTLNGFEQKMYQRYSGNPHINLTNFIKNEQIRIAIAEADLMVLPSRFDGWGAVVNEALGVGTPVLVSDQCGSSILVRDNPLLGQVFGPPDVMTLREALSRIIREGVPSAMRRKMIRDWADQHISGSVLANHLMCIIDRSSANSLQQTTAPWLRSSSQHLR
jgi:glycosyltransferase involved in cell wall biosynthesis